MRISLVHNRKAGGRYPSRRALQALLKEFGYELAHSVDKKDDWSALLEDPGEMVVVAGGDGTVGAVIRRLVRRDVAVAVLPLGTANNIASTFGIEGLTREVVAGWAGASPRRLDLGIAVGPWGKSWFVESFGLGLLATAMAGLDAQDKRGGIKRAPAEFKLFRDRLALAALAAEHPPIVVKGSLDDEDITGEYLLVEAMNIRSAGPAVELAPEADPADGQLDVAFVTADRRAALVDYLTALREGNPALPPTHVRRGRCLRVTGNGHDMHVDDVMYRPEPAPPDAHLDIEVTADAQAAQMLAPATRIVMDVQVPEHRVLKHAETVDA